MTAAEALRHPWLLTALSRPPSPKEEHSDPVKLPTQEDFVKAEQKEQELDGEEGLAPRPTLERRPTVVGGAGDTRVAV